MIKIVLLILGLFVLHFFRVKILKSLLGLDHGVQVQEGRGGVKITSKGGRTTIEVEDGGYVKARVNGKDIEMHSPPGSGPKRMTL